MSVLKEIFETDRKKQLWEICHKHALVLAAEIKAYLDAQKVITPETKEKIEKESGKKLDDELIGLKIGDYTDVMEGGKTKYDCLLDEATKTLSVLESATPENMSTSYLEGILKELNEVTYPEAMTVLYNGFLNISNAYTRREMGEKIIDFFEEHNFTLENASYEDDDDNKELYINLKNAVTSEELIITLAPDVTQDGGITTRVAIDQFDGDSMDEGRRKFYRDAIVEAASGISDHKVKANLACDSKTIGKFSSNIALKEKLNAE